MTYTLKFMDGSKAIITQDEFQSLAGKTGLVFVPSLGELVNISSIARSYPTDRDTDNSPTIDRTKQLEGISPDGVRLIKRFGQWYVANPINPYQYDDNGNSLLKYDGDPIVPTPEEYAKTFAALPVSEWQERLIGGNQERPQLLGDRTSTDGLTRI